MTITHLENYVKYLILSYNVNACSNRDNHTFLLNANTVQIIITYMTCYEYFTLPMRYQSIKRLNPFLFKDRYKQMLWY